MLYTQLCFYQYLFDLEAAMKHMQVKEKGKMISEEIYWHAVSLFSRKHVFSSRLKHYLLYPRHLCRRVYSFRLSVRMFVRNSVTFVEFASKFCVKVSQVVYISATTHQKAFIFGP